jgi:hypothetical protein
MRGYLVRSDLEAGRQMMERTRLSMTTAVLVLACPRARKHLGDACPGTLDIEPDRRSLHSHAR